MKPSTTKRSQVGQTNNAAKLLAPLLALYQSGHLEAAQKQAEELVAQYPALGLAWKILGSLYQQQGLLNEAAKAFEQACDTLSKDAEVFYNWGNVCFQQQALAQAQALYEKAIAIQPRFSQAHANLACVFKAQGQIKRAEKSFKQALSLQPKDAFVLSSLALLLHEADKPKEAMQYYRRAFALTPNDAVLLFNMAQAFEDVEDFAQAENFYKQAIELKPDYEDAIFNLALCYKKNEQFVEAERLFLALLKLNPDYENAIENLLSVYQVQGAIKSNLDYLRKRLEIKPSAEDLNNLAASLINIGLTNEAERYCLEAIALDDANADVYCNLGLVKHAKRKYQQACESFDKALLLNPESAITLSNYGMTLRAIGELSKAEDYLERAISLEPDFTNAYLNLSNIYLDKGEIAKSIEMLNKILMIEPEYTQAMQNLLMYDSYNNQMGADAHLAFAKKFGHIISRDIKAFNTWKLHPLDTRLRIGLLSGDFRNHPVCFFILNWLKNNKADKIEVYAYATDARQDEYTSEVKALCSQWHCLAGKTDQQAAELIHNDGLHILIDLSGHTAGGRMPIMAYKAAPIQAEWLGYWSTTGLPAIDYFISDPVSSAKYFENNFSEKIAYLPHTRMCYSPLESAPDVNELPALKNHFITFGCFQNYTKVNEDVLQLWAKVMQKLPNSQLRWNCRAFNDYELQVDALKRFEAQGISPERIHLQGELVKLAYLQAHHQIDFILDTFPFTGGTTTCDALWMGVPTLTLLGDTLISRQGASLMHATGLPEWVVNSKDDYVAKAVYWANHLDDLATLRQQLRQQVLTAPLMNAAQFAEDFEKLMFSLWHENLTKANPQAYLAHQPIQALYEGSQPVWVVSATRMDETSFWQQSALGCSLRRHMQQDKRLYPHITYNNTRGLSELFNEAIDSAPSDAVLVFIHDDVWLDQNTFTHQLLQGLSQYDVIGLAGNKRRVPAQASWLFADMTDQSDDLENVVGALARGQDAFSEQRYFGSAPASCELMDGVFLAASKQSLAKHQVRFDPQFKFHFYDLDFCRTARDAGMQLGVWPIALTRQHQEAFGTKLWKQTYLEYLDKWQETVFFQNIGDFMEMTINTTGSDLNVVETTADMVNLEIDIKNNELNEAINEVYQAALACQQAGENEQAEHLYKEILQIAPNHPDANHNLGFIEAQTKSVEDALLRFELAITGKPMCEQYWVSYFDALVMANETILARKVLEEGRKYGLSLETAQALLDELNQAQYTHNIGLIESPHQLKATKFLIVAPLYRDNSAGVMVLHELCDALNKRGYQTAIHFINMISHQPSFYGPGLKWYQLANDEEAQQFINEGVVIYPEVVTGNPLNAPRVVRYMLNSEGFVLNNSMQASAQDFILAFLESFHPNPHAILTKPCHFDVFNTENSLPAMERKMDLTYIGKGAHHGECFVLPGSVELTRTWPSNRAELAILLKNTRYLYTWDCRSQTVTDGLLCGAIPVYMSLAPFKSYEELHSDDIPNVLRTTATIENGEVQVHIPEDIEQRLNVILSGYSETLKVFEANIDNVLLQIVQHFGL